MVFQHVPATKLSPVTSLLLWLLRTQAFYQTSTPSSSTSPHSGFLHGSNLEQINPFSKWEAWVQKDQPGSRGCTLDSVSSNFHKVATSYNWNTVERLNLAEKKQSMALDTEWDVKPLNSRYIGTRCEQVKAHSGISPFLRITWTATEKS